MRLFPALLLFAGPLHAWEFSADPVSTIWHQTPDVEMRVIYDPNRALPYSIAVSLAEGTWPDASPYAIRFEGLNGFVITTDRHRLSDDASSVIASDTGFGNVLNGLEFNLFATVFLGDKSVPVSLADAAPVVRRFRDCLVTGLS